MPALKLRIKEAPKGAFSFALSTGVSIRVELTNQTVSVMPAEEVMLVKGEQGRVRSFLSRVNNRYSAWLDRTVEQNPGMDRERLSVMTGVVGGLAVFASVKFGPEVAEHVVSAFGDNPTVADGAAFSLVAGTAFGAGMNYLDRRRARKQAAK